MKQVATIGLDIARSVFRCMESMRPARCGQATLEPRTRVGVLWEAAALPGGHGGVQHLALLGARVDGAGS